MAGLWHLSCWTFMYILKSMHLNRKETKEHYQKCHHLTRLLHSQLQVKTFDINIHQQCINQPPPAKPHITASIWTPYVIDAGAEQSKLEHKIGCEFAMVSVYFT